MRKVFYCEVCDDEFDSELECSQHEVTCNPTEIFTCDKCGSVTKWNRKDFHAFVYESQCHNIHLGRAGYGSSLDGSDVNFSLCDDCLCAFIGTFKNKESIYNSGSNQYYEDDYDEDLEDE
jgi:hypothetical protein